MQHYARESFFNDADGGKKAFRAMFLAPLENLLHSKRMEMKEIISISTTPVVKRHQSLTTFSRRSLMNTPVVNCVQHGFSQPYVYEVHFHYLFNIHRHEKQQQR